MIRIGLLGHDAYTASLASILERQPDIELIGAYSSILTPLSKYISRITPIYVSEKGLEEFIRRGIKVSGFLAEFIESADYMIDYDARSLSFGVSYGGTGFRITVKEALLRRISRVMRVRGVDAEFSRASDRPLRPAAIRLRVEGVSGVKEVLDALYSSERVVVLQPGGPDPGALEVIACSVSGHLLYSTVVMAESVGVDGDEVEFRGLIGRFVSLPETLDTLRESKGVPSDIAWGMTNFGLNIKGGALRP